MGCHALLQGSLLTQGSILHLLHLLNWRVGSLPRVPRGKPHQCAGERSKGLQLEGDVFLSPSPGGRGRDHGEGAAGSLCSCDRESGQAPLPASRSHWDLRIPRFVDASPARPPLSSHHVLSESSHGGLPYVDLCPLLTRMPVLLDRGPTCPREASG